MSIGNKPLARAVHPPKASLTRSSRSHLLHLAEIFSVTLDLAQPPKGRFIRFLFNARDQHPWQPQAAIDFARVLHNAGYRYNHYSDIYQNGDLPIALMVDIDVDLRVRMWVLEAWDK